MSWHREITRRQWRTLFASQLGWMLDAMDVTLYSFALTAVRREFALTGAVAGALAAAPLVTSALGGILFGWLSDRYGRARALRWSILAFSAITGLTATAHSLWELVLWRSLAGIGLGGEWAAGSVLVAETWPAEHRGKAIGLMQSAWAVGYMLAAVLSAAVLPGYGWRVLFVLGLLPAVAILWMRRGVEEPPGWRASAARGFGGTFGAIFRRPVGGVVALVAPMCAFVLFGYWGLFTWLPAYLSSPVEKGGAGLTMLQSSGWIIPLQAGAFLGYVTFGFLADRFGRRPSFIAFVLITAALVPVYGMLGRSPALLMVCGPLIGYFGHGYFSVLGAMMAELFPEGVRATAQGFCYNIGRAVAGLAPVTVGALADRWGIGAALGVTSVFFVMGAAFMLLLPETRGRKLAK